MGAAAAAVRVRDRGLRPPVESDRVRDVRAMTSLLFLPRTLGGPRFFLWDVTAAVPDTRARRRKAEAAPASDPSFVRSLAALGARCSAAVVTAKDAVEEVSGTTVELAPGLAALAALPAGDLDA